MSGENRTFRYSHYHKSHKYLYKYMPYIQKQDVNRKNLHTCR